MRLTMAMVKMLLRKYISRSISTLLLSRFGYKMRGRGFDPNVAPDPLAQKNLMNNSGRGLLMMRAFMDEVDFMPSQTGTLVKMIKYFSSKSSPSHC